MASFGGNPNQVTSINGESAGGSSIELHLVAKNIEGLFHKAIAQSVYRTPLPTPEQQGKRFLRDCQLADQRRSTTTAPLRLLYKPCRMRGRIRRDSACMPTPSECQFPCKGTGCQCRQYFGIVNSRYASCLKVLVYWYANCSTASGYNKFLPVIDGKVLLDFPTRSILAGNFVKVLPLIVVWAYVMKVLRWILRLFIASI